MPMISTDVTGDVREHHFRCIEGHEFSILAKIELEMDGTLTCPVVGCGNYADVVADNSAQVSTNPADLLLT